MTETVPTLLISGTVGAGKTTLAYEIGDLLSEREVPNAVVDLDALTAHWPPTSRWNADLMFDNLAALWPIHWRHGARRLVMAHVVEDPAELDRYRAAVPGAQLTLLRVTAPVEMRLTRLRRRMPPGPSLDWHLNRTTELEAILEELAIEDVLVVNDERPIREVAEEVATLVGWD